MANTDPVKLSDLSSLALGLITLLSPSDFREPLLGDLQEEVSTKQFISRRAANRWLWSQFFRSSPSLIGHRLRNLRIMRVALLLLAYIVAFFALQFWDHEISRSVVGTFAAQDNPPSLTWLRTTYFVLFALGALVAGFLASPFGFKSNEGFAYNYVICFGPVFLILNMAIFIPVLTQGRFEALPYLATRSIIMAVTLAIGAYLYQRGQQALRPS